MSKKIIEKKCYTSICIPPYVLHEIKRMGGYVHLGLLTNSTEDISIEFNSNGVTNYFVNGKEIRRK